MAQEDLDKDILQKEETVSPFSNPKLKEELVTTLNVPHPAKLRRAITINPDDLNESFFDKAITTSTESVINGKWEKAVRDGNEYGTYMTDNENMVRSTNYSASWISVKVPTHNTGYGIRDTVDLPSCGIIYEIDTAWLQIRKPKIDKVLAWVYNNWFIWDERIANEIPVWNFKVKWLTLKNHPNDPNGIKININQDNYESSLKDAIQKIKGRNDSYKKMVEDLTLYLESLTDVQRMNAYKIKQRKDANWILV